VAHREVTFPRNAVRAGSIDPRMQGKVCIVTGSNTGIGKTTALGLARLGAKVVMAVRDVAKGEAARQDIVKLTRNEDVVVMPLDLADLGSVRAFAVAFAARFERLDVLVNNAGVTTRARTETKDGLETTFGVNHVGTALLTRELLPILKKSAPSRIVVVSSNLHYRGKMKWDDLEGRARFSGMAAYNQSKLANVLFTKALARRLEGTGVTVNALHPGVVATELVREYPAVVRTLWKLFVWTPERGAECSLHVATAPELEGVSGEFFAKSRSVRASRDALDVEQQEKLWSLTDRILARATAVASAA